MVKLNTINETDRKNLSTARITTIEEANGEAHPTSKGNGSQIAFRKIKDALVMVVLVLAIAALTGGWVFAIGWMALKLIQWIFA